MPVVLAVSAVLLVSGGLSLPTDLGSWVPAALPGEAVFALAPTAGGLLVGSGRGLYLLRPDGSVRDLGVHARVNALVQASGSLLVGTAEGLLALPAAGGPARSAGFDRVEVVALAEAAETTWAGTATGLYRRSVDGRWQRMWPEAGLPGSPVQAVLALGGNVVFGHPDGLARYDGKTGTVRVVYPGVQVVSLTAEGGAARLWAGLRGDPLLLSSTDAGSTWLPRSEGLGFTAVNAVVVDPSAPGRLVAGGSGLADGSGNAGVQVSDDGGRTWRARQGQLSNTHVFALLARSEPLRLNLHLPGVPGSTSVPLPFQTRRTYAGTNGGGVYTQRSANLLAGVLAESRPVLRLLEPLLAGLVILVCIVPAYRRLTPAARATPSDRRGSAEPGPPGRGPPRGPESQPHGRDPGGG